MSYLGHLTLSFNLRRFKRRLLLASAPRRPGNMSNKIVPNIYRVVIDDVINNIRPEFEEYGVNEDVLAELQAKWQAKVIASHVAEFDNPSSQPQQQGQQQHPPYGGHPIHIMQQYSAPPSQLTFPQQLPVANGPVVKSEPVDSRYILNPSYQLPPLPQLNGVKVSAHSPPPILGGQTSVISFPPGPPPIQPISLTNGTAGTPIGRAYIPPGQTATATSSSSRLPQVDGPAGSDDEDEDSPSPPAFAPRSSHPSLPQPQSQTATGSSAGDEAINSDLDDSDSENEEEADEGGIGETDIVFCTYDKVARVKNKWKCVLKDGMIHVNGRDYLFQKCTGEFEW